MASSSRHAMAAHGIQFPRLSPPLRDEADAYNAPLLPSPPASRADERQRKFVESLVQRRERIEFLRRAEWTRRVTDAQPHKPKSVSSRRASWDDIRALDSFDYEGRPPPIEEADEEEPYVIYATSPSAASSSVAHSPAPTHTPAPPPPSAYRDQQRDARRRSWRGGPHSRHSSLSSISEEDELEGLART